MGLKCSVRCANCGKDIVIKGGGLRRKRNRSLICPKCGHKNEVGLKKNGKVLVC